MLEYQSVFQNEIKDHLLLREKELGKEAYRHYRRTIELFDHYLVKINHKEKVVPEQIVEDWIKTISYGISVNTLGLHVHYLRQFLKYLVNCGFKCFIPKNVITHDTYIPYLYTDTDIVEIFKIADSFTAPKAVTNKYIGNEIPLILRLLYCCGLRVGEALSIKVGDIDFKKDLIILRVTKKYKQRLVPYGKDLSEIIHRYCVSMGILNYSDSYLFPADSMFNHVSESAVGHYFRIIRDRAGVKTDIISNGRGACLHCFRHSFAVRSFAKNEHNGIRCSESVPFLSTYLGHDSLYETEKYLKYSGDYFEDTLVKFETYSGNLFPEVSFDE